MYLLSPNNIVCHATHKIQLYFIHLPFKEQLLTHFAPSVSIVIIVVFILVSDYIAAIHDALFICITCHLAVCDNQPVPYFVSGFILSHSSGIYF